jgi:hypothetical protein
MSVRRSASARRASTRIAALSTVRAWLLSERQRTAANRSDSDKNRSSSGRENHSDDTRPTRSPRERSTLKPEETPNSEARPTPAVTFEISMFMIQDSATGAARLSLGSQPVSRPGPFSFSLRRTGMTPRRADFVTVHSVSPSSGKRPTLPRSAFLKTLSEALVRARRERNAARSTFIVHDRHDPHAAAESSAGLVGSGQGRRHPHRRARSASPCGVSCGPRACRVRVPFILTQLQLFLFQWN